MKNILLPTVLENDTLAAIESAISYASGANFSLVLLLPCDAQHLYSASAFLRNSSPRLSVAQQNVLADCEALIRKHQNLSLHFQRQPSVSAPLIKNLLHFFDIGLVIVPKSFRESDKKINRYCLGLLANSHCPILNLCETSASKMQKALYLDYAESKLHVHDVQQQLDGKFAFRIVTQARIGQEQQHSLQQMLAEAITRNDIDVLVETRKPEKVKLGKKTRAFHEDLRLPVLSVYEEIR